MKKAINPAFFKKQCIFRVSGNYSLFKFIFLGNLLWKPLNISVIYPMTKPIAKKILYSGKNPDSFDFKHILYKKADYTAAITINRPEVYNCLNLLTSTELTKSI